LWQDNKYTTLKKSIDDIKIETKPKDVKINRARISKGLVKLKYFYPTTQQKCNHFQQSESKSNIDLS